MGPCPHHNPWDRRFVNRYLEAFYLGNFDAAQPVLADCFSFRGPFVEAVRKRVFLEHL
jgi:hypothetical protein